MIFLHKIDLLTLLIFVQWTVLEATAVLILQLKFPLLTGKNLVKSDRHHVMLLLKTLITQCAAPHQPSSPLVTEENLMAEVNKGASVFICIQCVRLQLKEQVELEFSTITKNKPVFQANKDPWSVTERKHHLCTAVKPVRTAAVFREIVRSGHLDSLTTTITTTTDVTVKEESD